MLLSWAGRWIVHCVWSPNLLELSWWLLSLDLGLNTSHAQTLSERVLDVCVLLLYGHFTWRFLNAELETIGWDSRRTRRPHVVLLRKLKESYRVKGVFNNSILLCNIMCHFWDARAGIHHRPTNRVPDHARVVQEAAIHTYQEKSGISCNG